MDSPWQAEGEWLRATLHTHSTAWDGELPPRAGARHIEAVRIGYRYGADILETTPDGLIVAARPDRAATAPFARVEVVDPSGRKAWTNSL